MPADDWPLLEYRRRTYKPWPNSPIMKLRGRSKYLKEVEIIREKGPVCSGDLPPSKGRSGGRATGTGPCRAGRSRCISARETSP